MDALVQNGHLMVTLCLLLASAVLMHALFWQDYSLEYAANYTDKYLSTFYRLTAFWAGQAGSMLFWALVITVTGTLFTLTKGYQKLSSQTKLWFWVFYHPVNAFFTLLLAVYSNPFIMQNPAPLDGNGLNPLLQNPGMIIHPPLLFIGYGVFLVPACLALAQHTHCDGEGEIAWHSATRGFLMTAWVFLTAGIMLGAWWAYMELGWGGYWAWDPVENSSLVPWLLATACLHTVLVERRSKKLVRFNVFLISLTTISTFFATFLVRSGVIDSVHAFGRGSVGTPLLTLVCVTLLLCSFIAVSSPRKGEALSDITSREGLLAIMSWFLIAIAAIISLATVWPILSKAFSNSPVGLDAHFYNRVCLPLAAIVLLLLACCRLVMWNKTRFTQPLSTLLILSFVASGLLLWYFGYQEPTAILATSACVAILLGLSSRLFSKERRAIPLGAWGAHLGLTLCALGIAFSGPYSQEKNLYLAEGESVQFRNYTLRLEHLGQEDGAGYSALLARIQVFSDGKLMGVLQPERRMYEKFGDMQFSEVDTIPSLLNELYVSLLGLTSEKKILVRFSIKPLVNWLWIGSFLMSIFPLLALAKKKKQNQETDND